jgi:cytochrome b pre-mRNA-processing protein 3
MDDSLRELGTGDTGVLRRVKRAAAGFYVRGKAYRDGIAAGGRSLELALARHLAGTADAGIDGLASYMRTAGASLARGQTMGLMEGRVAFPDPAGAARGVQ